MNYLSVLFLALLFVMTSTGCGREVKNLKEEMKLLKEENSFLKAENAGLKKEIEELYKKLEEQLGVVQKISKPEEVKKPAEGSNAGVSTPRKPEPALPKKPEAEKPRR